MVAAYTCLKQLGNRSDTTMRVPDTNLQGYKTRRLHRYASTQHTEDSTKTRFRTTTSRR